MKTAKFGTVSSGTLRNEDLAESFLNELLWLLAQNPEMPEREEIAAKAKSIETEIYSDSGEITEDSETLSDIVSELSDILDQFSPPYSYFGAHEGDGADFGFWPSWDSLRDLESFSDFPETLPEDDFTVVNDHGNTSLYGCDGKLIWDIV